MAALTACSAMPQSHGPSARFAPGFTAPRDRAALEITVHRHANFLETTAACYGELPTGRAILEAIGGVIYLACARFSASHERCTVHVIEGDHHALEHEMRHCEGWDHPIEVSDAGDGEK